MEGLQVLNHIALVKTGGTLTIPDHLLDDNAFGCFVRKGRVAGLALTSGPRLFLWNNFAAYSDKPFIIQHSKVGLAGGNAQEIKAVAAIWNSSYVAYLLFFVLSSDWGVGYSLIDKGDAENLPFPELTPEREKKLCEAWEEAAGSEAAGASFSDVKTLLDRQVAVALRIPASISLVVNEFFGVRYQLDRGKNPPFLRASPSEPEMKSYASRLRSELDGFLGGKAHHQIKVLHSTQGICVSVTLIRQREVILPEVKAAEGQDAAVLKKLLEAAETQFSQWVYVKRSVRIFDGNTIHVVKPPRRIEWTETQALMDADDFIAETIEEHNRRNG